MSRTMEILEECEIMMLARMEFFMMMIFVMTNLSSCTFFAWVHLPQAREVLDCIGLSSMRAGYSTKHNVAFLSFIEKTSCQKQDMKL